jgi:hypothetical protein
MIQRPGAALPSESGKMPDMNETAKIVKQWTGPGPVSYRAIKVAPGRYAIELEKVIPNVLEDTRVWVTAGEVSPSSNANVGRAFAALLGIVSE